MAPHRASGGHPYGHPLPATDKAHITALHEAFIQNWTSPNFSRFVDACKSIVDELANAQTSGNGMTEMRACERVFKQVTWLWTQTWPEVDGMGEKEDLAVEGGQQDASPGHAGHHGENRASNGNPVGKAIEIPDDEDADADATVDSPYGGTGLGAIAAANRGV